MDRDQSLRQHLSKLLDWEDAHVGFERSIKGIDPKLSGVVPEGFAHSAWQLLEHLRICQFDILDFCRNSEYVERAMEEYWPPDLAPPSARAWNESVAAFRRDLKELKCLAANPAIDLFEPVPHGAGQTYLRELLLVADHNAYHVGQIIAVRRSLGIWKH